MKNIAFTVARLGNKGGTERMATSLANALSQRGYSISLISIQPFDGMFFSIDKRIKVFQLLEEDTDKRQGIISKAKAYPDIIYSLNKIVKDNKIDILIDVDVDLSFFSLFLKLWNKKIKIVAWEHFNYNLNLGLKRRNWARTMAKKYADAIVVLTLEDKEAYEKDGKSNAPIFTIINFLDSIPNETAELNAKKVLAVGHLIPRKGFDILINVWSEVKKRACSEGWILQIVGNGEEKEKLIKQRDELNLTDTIEFIPPTTKIWDYFLNSSIFVLSSRNEGFGLVLLEALSVGVPSVTFDCPMGPSEIIKENEDSFLIPAYDGKLMAEKICLLMEDENLRRRMGAKAKENSKRFAKEKIIDQWVDFLNSL